MKILDKYIAKKFIVSVIFMLVIASVVSVIFDVSEKIEDFLDYDLSAKVIVGDYYIHFIPVIINLLSPIVVFIAALYFTSRLANNSEIISILAGGVSYYRLLVPYLVVAIMLAGVDWVAKNYFVPKAYARVVDFEMKYVEGGWTNRDMNIHLRLDKNTYFYANLVNYQEKLAHRFAIERFDGQKLVYKLRSRDATYDSARNVWVAKYYVLREIDGLKETLTSGDSLLIKLPITIDEFGRKVKSMPSMTTPELDEFIDRQQLKGESQISFYLIEKYRRTASPFAIIVLVLIAVTLATRKIRGGMGMHLLIGIFLAVLYMLFMRFSTTFATNSDLSPFMAVWLPNFVFSILALVLLRYSPK